MQRTLRIEGVTWLNAEAEWYDVEVAAALLNIHVNKLRHWARTGIVPGRKIKSDWSIRRERVEILSRYLLDEGAPLDDAWAMLVQERELYHSPPKRNPATLIQHRAAVHKRCQKLIDAEKAVTLQWLSNNLAAWLTWPQVRSWAHSQKIVTVSIGATRYLALPYAEQIIWQFAECVTLQEAADELGIPVRTLYDMHYDGRAQTFKGIDNLWRLPINSLEALKHAPLTGSSILAAAARLGFNVSRIKQRVRQGQLPMVTDGGRQRVPDKELAKIQAQFDSLNPGFEWLAPVLATGRQPPTVYTKGIIVARKLNVSPSAVRLWAKKDMLPFYVRGFGGGHTLRQFVARYIDGFAAFIGNQPATQELLREYNGKCARAKNIV